MSSRAKAIILLLGDFISLFLALTLAIVVRRSFNLPSEEYLLKHYNLFLLIFPVWTLMYFIEGLYTLRTYNPSNLSISIIRGTFLALITSFALIYLFNIEDITPKTVLILTAFLTLPILLVWRNFFTSFFSNESRLRSTILIGQSETSNLVMKELQAKTYLGFKITQTLDENTQSFQISSETDLIAIDRSIAKNNKLYHQIFFALENGIEVIDLAAFAEKVSGKIPIQSIDESWFIEYCGHSDSRSFDVLKNLIDRSIAFLMIAFLIPLAMILFPILLIVHGRPIFFKQTRTGLNNRPFTLYKLRSMVTDAEKNGAQWAKPGDARVTPLGKILRKTRLDELPQLINILKGEMSLVGPRPERPEIINTQLEPNIPFYKMRHLVKPGVTGWAQVTFRYGFSQEDSKEKLQYDLYYVKNRSPWLDLLVLFKTIKTVLTGAGQ